MKFESGLPCYLERHGPSNSSCTVFGERSTGSNHNAYQAGVNLDTKGADEKFDLPRTTSQPKELSQQLHSRRKKAPPILIFSRLTQENFNPASITLGRKRPLLIYKQCIFKIFHPFSIFSRIPPTLNVDSR
jgi:hypothetical protein